MQKRAVRVILDYNVENSHEAMKSLNIQSIYYCLFLRKAKFMFKVYHNLTPTYISENYNLCSNFNISITSDLHQQGVLCHQNQEQNALSRA